MPLFSYQVLDKLGNPLDGKLEAEHEWAASNRLRKMGYTVLEIKELSELSLKQLFRVKRKVSTADLGFFTRQLAAMIGSGIPLTRCLYALSDQNMNKALAKISGEIARNVEGGISFSESLRAYPEVFPSIYVDMVKAGELGGILDQMLRRLASQLEREKALQDSIKSATFYPALICVFAICVVVAMMYFIVPMFMGFIPEGTPIPLPTQIVLAISDSMRNFWYVYLLGFITFVIGLRTFLSKPSGKALWDKLRFKLPVFGNLFKKVAVARFSRTFATLLAGGIPVLQALDAAGPASGSGQIAQVVKDASREIQQGKTIAEPLMKSEFFPAMVTNMVSVGEETGELSSMMDKVADFYEEEVATMTKGLAALLEPLLLIFIGFIVGGIVISIYLPIFSVVTKM